MNLEIVMIAKDEIICLNGTHQVFWWQFFRWANAPYDISVKRTLPDIKTFCWCSLPFWGEGAETEFI